MGLGRLAITMALGSVTIASLNQPAVGQSSVRPDNAHVAAAESAINEQALRGHIRFLASDLLEGRGPGSRGDELAEHYIAAQFESLGLKPCGRQRLVSAGAAGRRHCPRSRNADVSARRRESLELKRHDDYVFASGKAQTQGRRSTTPRSCSWATASRPPSTNGTISKEPTCAARFC